MASPDRPESPDRETSVVVPPTLEEIWSQYGWRIEALARGAFPDDDAVRTVSVRVMEAFAQLLVVRPDLAGASPSLMRHWLLDITHRVCDTLQPDEVVPGSAKTPMPDAIPARVRDGHRLRLQELLSDQRYREQHGPPPWGPRR